MTINSQSAAESGLPISVETDCTGGWERGDKTSGRAGCKRGSTGGEREEGDGTMCWDEGDGDEDGEIRTAGLSG